MGTSKIAAKTPIPVEVEKGKTYAWCSCGHSTNQPFCDGSHRGTSFTPMMYTAEETKTAWFCQCKVSNNKPFCDGSHTKL